MMETSPDVKPSDLDDASNESNDTNEESDQKQHVIVYNPRKPKWWRQQYFGRGTKSQREAIAKGSNRLPRVAYGEFLDWNKVFQTDQVWLELGFGQGENLLVNSMLRPNVGFVGVEIHKPGVGTAMKRINSGVDSGQYWDGYNLYDSAKDPKTATQVCDTNAHPKPDRTPYSNVRVHIIDGIKFLSYVPQDSLSVIMLTFPDPWPAERDAQYRLIQNQTVKELYRVLHKVQGRFFLATDDEGYSNWCQYVFQQVNNEATESHSPRFRKVDPCPNRSTWLPAISKYEQKGWNEGRRTMMQCWEVWPVDNAN